tara:strand:+ start:1239 stop:2297 length:1059 start_codon:yes stop_codon:yes gene_type:complete
MLTYKELTEKKLSKLNQQYVGTVKGLETAMHSQGIDPGQPERDSHHVQYPKATFKKSGKPAHGITAVDNGKGKLTSSTGGETVRDAVLKSGRVDKRPKAKAKRKEEAAANKERKAKQRNPFTREHTEWWIEMIREATAEQYRIANQRKANRVAAGGKGDEGNADPLMKDAAHQGNKEKARRQQQGNAVGYQGNKAIEKKSPGTVQPSPGGKVTQSRGGALAKREPNSLAKTPPSKGSDIVRTQSRPPSARNTTDKPAQGGALARRSPSSPEGPDNTYADRRKERLDRQTADKTAKRDQTTRSLSNAANTGLKYANKAGKYASNLAKSTRGKVGDSKAGQVQGSSEIIRGSRS